MQPLRQPARTARVADLVLHHDVAQRFSFRTVGVLLDISRGEADDIAPDDAVLLVHMALKAVVTFEIAAVQQAGATGGA